ncbi:MAG: type ISP restriction/modification enzyme [Ginsengibacter sp.]
MNHFNPSKPINDWLLLIPILKDTTVADTADKAIFNLSLNELADGATQKIFDVAKDAFKNEAPENRYIFFPTPAASMDFFVFSSDTVVSLAETNCKFLPFYNYNDDGKKSINISDEALQKFKDHYESNESASPVCYANSPEIRDDFKIPIAGTEPVCKENIFYYVYAVLHYRPYRKKYKENLQQDFPHIPLYQNFGQWVRWGKKLMTCHMHYENAALYPLEKSASTGKTSSTTFPYILKEEGRVVLDETTVLQPIPASAFNFKLGRQSALEITINQYQNKISKSAPDEKLNDSSDEKQKIIELIKKICTISVQTLQIMDEMERSHQIQAEINSRNDNE